MATVSYKCNVCKREIELLENPQGLTTMSKCVITYGCKGKLNPIKRNPDNIREVFPANVTGLEDYTPRLALFSFSQQTPSTVWNITHNLNSNPAVTVFLTDNSGNVSTTPADTTTYTIKVINSNQIQLTFLIASKGSAQLSSRSSVKFSLPTVSSAIPNTQVTANGYFVFAIPKYLTKFTYPPTLLPTPKLPYDLKNSPIRIQISLQKPNQEPIVCTETLDNSLVNTAWLGWNEVLIRKRKDCYLLAKSILKFQIFGEDNLTFKQIPDNTRLKITGIDYGTGVIQPIDSEGLYILLANSPYTSVDKIQNKIVNAGGMYKNSFDYFIYSQTDFFTDPSNVEPTYPDIIQIQ